MSVCYLYHYLILKYIIFTLLLLLSLICRIIAICRLTRLITHGLIIDLQFATNRLVELQLTTSRLLDPQLISLKLLSSQFAHPQLSYSQLAGWNFRISRYFYIVVCLASSLLITNIN